MIAWLKSAGLTLLVGFLIGAPAGAFFDAKLLRGKCPELTCPELTCPDCVCPPAVSMQTFDPEKINNKRGEFHLHNSLSNVTIKIEAKDSLLLKQLLRSAK